MIILVVADTKNERVSYITQAITQVSADEVITLYDTDVVFTDLEQYLYPSLFVETVPVVHAKFIVSAATEIIDVGFIKQLLASPTIFILEELALPTPILTLFKKSGAVVHTGLKEVGTKKKDDIFGLVSTMISQTDKKKRWLEYRTLIDTTSIEAMLGIIYWKVRELSLRDAKYKLLYERLIQAHADSWKRGVPLELGIEKVLLS